MNKFEKHAKEFMKFFLGASIGTAFTFSFFFLVLNAELVDVFWITITIFLSYFAALFVLLLILIVLEGYVIPVYKWFKKHYDEIREYNQNIREQKRKNQELFEPASTTRILDEDLEDDLNRSWAHYESKRK